jgi:hypothetical protein
MNYVFRHALRVTLYNFSDGLLTFAVKPHLFEH